MKLNKETLKRIIKEELEAVLDESQLLDRYSKGKEEEFRQYLRDMGKDPDEVIDTLGPEQASVMRQTLIDDYPTSMKVPGAKPVRGGEQVLELIKIMGERGEVRTDLYATPTGNVTKVDHGGFGVGYDVEFEWNDGKKHYLTLIEKLGGIYIPSSSTLDDIRGTIRSIDSQRVLNNFK